MLKTLYQCKLNHRGFTLIELLVVMVLVALFAGVAVVSFDFGDGDRHVETEARRLQELLKLAQQEAVLKVKTYVLQTDREAYSFLELDEVKKIAVPMTKDDIFRTRKLARGIEMKVTVQEDSLQQYLSQGEDKKNVKEKNPNLRYIVLFASGEMTPFEIRLRGESTTEYVLTGTIVGQLALNNSRETRL